MKHTNQLSNEQSPYLLQHQHNPVDWHPWNDDAFELAREQNKPVFLSVGYATCHWCHVMAHESFEDEAIAELMNEAFINIKVDREERPDIDQTYMTVCQMLTGHGGWPLTIVMTPDKNPFFAATYIPKDNRFERVGMRQLIPALSHTWKYEREKIDRAIASIQDGFAKQQVFHKSEFPGVNSIEQAFARLSENYDPEHGGIGSAPKFPTPHNLIFLLRYANQTESSEALQIVTHTLKSMRKGGIFDQIGFGFHRYSTDRMWLLPHFEKMLYDQALLMMAYTEAYQLTKTDLFKQTAYEILEYIVRDLKNESGGFYSAEDADSEGEEGKFYTWSTTEIDRLLGGKYADLAKDYFNLYPEGNFNDEATRKKTGTNIPHLHNLLAEYAEEKGLDAKSLSVDIEHIRGILFKDREKRIGPLLDDKVLTDWNSLMIVALAKMSFVFDDSEILDLAKEAVHFIETKLVKGDVLYHRYRNEETAIPGFADDYAFFIWALLEVYQAGFDSSYLAKAIFWNEGFIENFWDEQDGGFFFSNKNTGEELLGAQKHTYDGALPTANSVAMNNLVRLSKMTGNTEHLNRVQNMGALFSVDLTNYGSNHTQAMQALQLLHQPGYEIVIAEGDNGSATFLNELRKKYLPNSVILKRPASDFDLITNLSPFLKNQKAVKGETTIYVCQNYACKQPITLVKDLESTLNQV